MADAIGAPRSRQCRMSAPFLPAPLAGERHDLDSDLAGRVSYVVSGPKTLHRPPLLLVHSINAAASAYEVKPLFDRYRETRRVYALDLPGFGLSDRSDRAYVPRLMTDALHAMVDAIAAREGHARVDVIGLSLSCEFVARAAVERPGAYRSVALVSPTGLDRRAPLREPPGTTSGKPRIALALRRSVWDDGLYRWLTARPVIRFFLEKTWGSKAIDEGLLEYDAVTVKQPGASRAPLFFITGFLFSRDMTDVYESIAAPVWMVRGTRGDFVDYRDAPRIAAMRGWSCLVLETGALPHFEDLDAFTTSYDRFVRSS